MQPPKPPEPPPQRLKYEPPVLIRMGTAAELTRNVGRRSMRDGGRGMMRRSQP